MGIEVLERDTCKLNFDIYLCTSSTFYDLNISITLTTVCSQLCKWTVDEPRLLFCEPRDRIVCSLVCEVTSAHFSSFHDMEMCQGGSCARRRSDDRHNVSQFVQGLHARKAL